MATATKTRPPEGVVVRKATKTQPPKQQSVTPGQIQEHESKPVTTPTPGSMKIASRVKGANGLLKITLGDLRDELGFSRLGRHVLARMAQHLTVNNLGFFPADILDPENNVEPRQWQELWVFVNDGSPRAEVMQAIGDPEEFDLATALDHLEGAGVPGRTDYSKMTLSQRLKEISRLANV